MAKHWTTEKRNRRKGEFKWSIKGAISRHIFPHFPTPGNLSPLPLYPPPEFPFLAYLRRWWHAHFARHFVSALLKNQVNLEIGMMLKCSSLLKVHKFTNHLVIRRSFFEKHIRLIVALSLHIWAIFQCAYLCEYVCVRRQWAWHRCVCERACINDALHLPSRVPA